MNRFYTLSPSAESNMEKFSDTDRRERQLCVPGSGVRVLEWSITAVGEGLTWGGSTPVQFSTLSSDTREPRTEAWKRSG